MLLKVALILGCEFIENVTFEEICPRSLVGFNNNKNNGETKGTEVPAPSTPSSSSPVLTPKRKCSFATELSSTCEGDETDGNICSQAEVPADEVIELVDEFSGTSDSEEDSDSSPELSADGKKVKSKEEEDEGIKERLEANKGSRRASTTSASELKVTEAEVIKVKCTCCCHLHGAGSEKQSTVVSSCHQPSNCLGAYAHFSVTSANPTTASSLVDYNRLVDKLNGYQFNVILGADGRRNTLNENFLRKEFRGRLAIAITANYINRHTLAEAQIPEISGISFIYNQQLFK